MKQRQFALLRLVLAEETILEEDFRKQYQISKRTFQYDIKAINNWLAERKLPEVDRSQVGALSLELTRLMKDQIVNDIGSQSIPFHQMNDKARREFLLFSLFLETGYISTKLLCDRFSMSRNSIRKLLVDLETEFEDEEIAIISRPKLGWLVAGNEDAIKRVFVKRFHGIFMEQSKGILIQRNEIHQLVSGKIPRWDEWIRERSSMVSSGITDRSSGRVIASLVISILRHQPNEKLGSQPIQIPVLEESGALPKLEALIEDYDFQLDKQDHAFCAKYLLGNRAIDVDQKFEVVFDALPSIVKTMVKDMSEISSKPIREPERLVKSLIVHLQPTIFRIRFGIEVENALLQQIQERYQGYYRAARIASRPLEQHFSIQIPPEEVAFIAMHFGAFIEKEQKEKNRILLVCHEGMATVRLIQARLQEEFDSFEIIGIMSRHSYSKMKNLAADLIITTIRLENRGIPIVVVEPLLSDTNQRELARMLTKRKIRQTGTVEKIVNEIEKYATIHQPRLLKHSIHEIIEGKRSGKKLSEILPVSRIQLGIRVESWQEAVGAAAEPLLADGAITEGYYLKMMENIERFRAYVVVKKFVAMPHARPEDGALSTQASLVVLSKGVKFGHPKNDPVRVVFILTAVDPTQHLQALETFRKMIGTEEALLRLKQMQSQEECRQWIKELEE